MFNACVGRHNDLKKIKAPDLNKSFWGAMQTAKPKLENMNSDQIKEQEKRLAKIFGREGQESPAMK